MEYPGAKLSEETLGAVLKDQVDVLGVIEEPIQLQYVGMVHIYLQFDLPEDLALHIGLLDLALVHHLQREQCPAIFVLRDVDVPESPAAEFLAKSKLADFQLGVFLFRLLICTFEKESLHSFILYSLSWNPFNPFLILFPSTLLDLSPKSSLLKQPELSFVHLAVDSGLADGFGEQLR